MKRDGGRALYSVARDVRLVRGLKTLSAWVGAVRLIAVSAVCAVVCVDLYRLIRRA